MLSLASGHDPEYLTATVGAGREGYYTGAVAEGEPPGVWWGTGAEALGLSGEVDAEVMEALYKHLVDPRDPAIASRETWDQAATVGAPHRKFRTAAEIYQEWIKTEPRVTPEVQAQLRLQAQRWERQPVAFVDATFSAPKSVSLLGVGFERAAQEALLAGDVDTAAVMNAYHKAVEDAVMAGASAALEYLQDRAGYCRVGHHGGGAERWDDAHAFVAAQFLQHDSRARDPQLHVHQAILNRTLGADGQWRALDTVAIRSWRAAAGAVAERVMEAHLAQSVGVRFEWRPDGKAREVLGVDRGLCEVFSKRHTQITRRIQPLVDGYVQRHGVEPPPLVLHRMKQAANLITRKAKSHTGETTQERLDRIEAEAQVVVGGLGRVAAEALAAGRGASNGGAWSVERVLAKAAGVAADAHQFTESDAVRAVSDALPGHLGLPPNEIRGLIDDLAKQLLGRMVGLRAPESAMGLPADRLRADGSSQYRSPRAARVAHPDTLAAQQALRDVATSRSGLELVDARLVSTVVEAYAQLGIELGADQIAALRGVSTSAAGVEVLCAPAGAGKSVVVGALGQLWAAGQRRMVGLTTSENAAEVLRGEGVTARNVAQWLATQDRLATGRALDGDDAFTLTAGDLVVLDEANMTGTTDLASVSQWCRQAGAKLLLVGDPHQLSAVDGAGVLADLVGRAPSHELSEVRRFREDWERAASLQLRAGDAAAVLEYAKHGRLQAGGTAAATEVKAIHAYLVDLLAGRDSLLLVGSNEAAARVSEQVREHLIELGQLVDGPVVELGRQGTVAGVGDLVEARRNAWDLGDHDRQAPVNRRTYRVTHVQQDGGITVVSTAGGAPLVLPAEYVAEDLALGYASTVHAAEGRTVDTCHAVLSAHGADPGAAYVALTRGRERNTAWMVTRAEIEDAATGETARGIERDPAAVLAEVLDRTEHDTDSGLSDLVYAEEQAARAASTKTSLDRLIDQVEGFAATRTSTLLDQLASEGLLSTEQRAALAADGGETQSLAAVLREAEITGADPAQLLRGVLAGRELAGATSVAAVLRARVRRGTSEATTAGISSYADLIPAGVPEQRRAGLLGYAWAADERRRVLGAGIVTDPPRWAREFLGPVPSDVIGRAEWEHRAGWIAAHRERADWTDDTAALGPAPPRTQPERYAIWRAAHTALGSPDAGDEQAGMSEAQLRADIDAYERAEAWAPKYVGDELAATWHAVDTAHQDAVLQEHYAGTSQDPARAQALRTDAARARAEAIELQARTARLEREDRDRGQWYSASAESRDRAHRAHVALQIRDRARDDRATVEPPAADRAAADAHTAVDTAITHQRQANAAEQRHAQLARWHDDELAENQSSAGQHDELATP